MSQCPKPTWWQRLLSIPAAIIAKIIGADKAT